MVGASGAGGGSVIGPLIYNAVLGTKFKIVYGYQGGTRDRSRDAARRGRRPRQQYLGGLQGDMPDEIRDGMLNVLIQTGLRKEPDLPHVPLFLDLVKGDPAREPVAKFMSYAVAIARPFAAPPGVPADRVETAAPRLRRHDEGSRLPRRGRKLNAEIDPLTGEQVQDVVTQVLATPKPIINQIQTVLGLPPN